MPKIVGLLVGLEETFPGPFLDMVTAKGREHGIKGEMVELAGTPELEEPRYSVIVDRISHEIPYYRAYLKHASLQGTVVVNDPFWWEADEKFFECTLARKVGVAVPRTVALPNKDYIPEIDLQRSLRNVREPDWEAIVRYTGLPVVMKPNKGGGNKDIHVCNTVEELVAAYQGVGIKGMIVQELIDYDDYVRCICIGREHVLPLRYHHRLPRPERYRVDDPPVGALRDAAIASAMKLVQALGYDMDTVEMAVKDGTLYAIDFLNPAPDLGRESIKEEAFQWAIGHLSDLVIAYATGETIPPWHHEHRWWRYVGAD